MTRLTLFYGGIFIALFLLFTSTVIAQTSPDNQTRGFYLHLSPSCMTTTSFVDWTEHVEQQLNIGNVEIHKAFQTRSEQLNHIFALEFNQLLPKSTVTEILTYLHQQECITLAEFIPLYTIDYTPNDLDPLQYNIDVTQAEAAWDLSTGNPNIKVAVVDDAFRMDHEDLQGSWATNLNEIPGNGIDDDGNGFIDDVMGWDAADQNNDPNPPLFSDADWTHGTHVAGIVAAETDNGVGISAIGFNTKMIPVKCTNASPAVTHGYEGVDYAINSGANIISMSWGGPGTSVAGQALMDAATAAGILCVAAAGNNNSSVPMYPASFNNVICVGATDQNDVRASFSNYGTLVDVMAPGVDILSCLAGSTSSYGPLSGTSMATPFVSGLCALMLAQNPQLTPAEIEECLESTCDDIDALNPNYLGQIGAGRVNALQALLCVSAVYASFEPDLEYVCPGGSVQFNDLSMNNPTSWSWTFEGGTPATSTSPNPNVTYANPGVYDVTLEVSNLDGTHEVTYTDLITVDIPEVSLSGSTVITEQMDTWLIAEMTGIAPWTLEVNDGVNTVVYNNIEATPFQFQVEPDETTTYTITSFESGTCQGTVLNDATVAVIPAPDAINCFYTNIFGDGDANGTALPVVDPLDYSVYVAGGSNGQATLSHFNPDGTLNWTKTYSGTEGARGLVRSPNGDLVFLTSDNSTGYKVIRVTSNGDVVWSKKYNWGYDRFPQITRTLGDTYLIAGWSNFGGVSDNLVVIKVDNNGDLLWEAFFDEVDDQFSSVVPTDDGGCLVTGGLHIIGGNLNYFFARLDSDGNTVFKQEYDSSPTRDDNPTSWLLSDGGYAIAGQILGNDGTLHVFISKLNATLDHEWSYEFGSGLGDDYAFSVREDSQGNIVGAFRMNVAGGETEPLFLKFDAAGNLLWAKRQPDMVYGRLEHVSPGSFLISGSADENNQFGNNDGIIIHEDEDLSSCIFEDTEVELTPIVWVGGVWPANEYPATAIISDINVNDLPLDYDFVEMCPLDCPTPCDAVADFTLVEDWLCEAGLLSINNNSEGDDYQWLLDGVLVSTDYNPLITLDQPGQHSLTLMVTQDSCSVIQNESITLSLLDLTTSGGGMMCVGDSISISAQSLNADSMYWTPGSSLAGMSAWQTLASPATTTTYVAHATDQNGCEVTEEVIVEVDPSCCVSWIDIDYDPILCMEDEEWFENQTNVTGNGTWTWDWPTGVTSPLTEGAEPTGVAAALPGQWELIVQLEDQCGTAIDTLLISIFENPIADAGLDTLMCDASPIQIGSTPLAYHTYQWSNELSLSDLTVAQPIASPTEPTWYYLYVEDIISGCSAIDSVEVLVDQPLDLGPAYLGCYGDTLVVSPAMVPGNWEWSDGETDDELIIVESGDYELVYTNSCGSKTDALRVELEYCDCPVFVPNAFTPNTDGHNEIFKPVVTCSLNHYKFEVWDRWGELVFATDDPTKGWMGNSNNGEYYVPDGMYVWKVELEGALDPANSVRKLTGHVSVIR